MARPLVCQWLVAAGRPELAANRNAFLISLPAVLGHEDNDRIRARVDFRHQ